MISIPTGDAGDLISQPVTARIDELTAQVAGFRHGKVPSDLRRAHVLAIAFGLFSERGFHDVSMDEIAASAGVSKPVVYGLLGDKAQIFRASAELASVALAEKVGTAMRAEREPEAFLRAGARAFFEFVAESGPGWDMLLSSQGGPVSAVLEDGRRRQAQVVAGLLGELFAELGSPLPSLSIEAIAHSMNGACESLAAWWRRHPEVGIDDVVELSTRLIAPGVIAVIEEPFGGWSPTGT